ncbi:MAG: ATP-binding protein [Phycisphaerales bacterium]|nr:ATP-binding protein [Phycisphaerales bacterium]
MLAAILISLACGLLLGAIVARVLYRREAQARIAAEQRAQQAERLAELGSMTGGLAHEIKNPLSTIGLNAQLLAEAIEEIPEAPLRSRLTTRVGALRRETDRLRGILQDFLDYAGNVRLERQRTDLRGVLSDMVEFLLPEAERAGVRLRLDVPTTEQTLTANIDQRLFKQALLNLLLNAIQAISAGRGPAGPGEQRGEVILRAANIAAASPSAGSSAGQAAPGVRIDISDTGPGITPEHLDKIFRPYFTTKAGGTGLGLPTSRRYIQEHGGTLTCDSQPGVGTRFVITLPG